MSPYKTYSFPTAPFIHREILYVFENDSSGSQTPCFTSPRVIYIRFASRQFDSFYLRHFTNCLRHDSFCRSFFSLLPVCVKFHPFPSSVKSTHKYYNHSAIEVIARLYLVVDSIVKSFRWGSWSCKFDSALYQPQQHQRQAMAWFNRNEPYTFDEELDDDDEECLRAMALLHSRGYAVTKMSHFQNIGRNPLQTKQSVEVQTQIGEERLSSFGKPGVALNSPPMSSPSSSGQVERRPDATPMEVEDSSPLTAGTSSTTPPTERPKRWAPEKRVEAPSPSPKPFSGSKATPGMKVKGAKGKPANLNAAATPAVPNIFGAANPVPHPSPVDNSASTPKKGRKRRSDTRKRVSRSQRKEKNRRKAAESAAANQQEAEEGEVLGAEGGEEEEEEVPEEEEEEQEAEAAAVEAPPVPAKRLKRPDLRVALHKRKQSDKDVFNQLVDSYKNSGEYQFLFQQSKYAMEEALRERKAARGTVRGGRGRGRAGRISRPPPLSHPIDYRDLPHSDPQWKAENDAMYLERQRIQHAQMEAARREYDSTTQFFDAAAPPRLYFSGKNVDTKIAATLDANRRNPIMNRANFPIPTLQVPLAPSASVPAPEVSLPPLTPEDLRRYADQLEQGDLFAI